MLKNICASFIIELSGKNATRRGIFHIWLTDYLDKQLTRIGPNVSSDSGDKISSCEQSK